MPPSFFLQCDVLEVFGDYPSLPCFGWVAFFTVVFFSAAIWESYNVKDLIFTKDNLKKNHPEIHSDNI